MNTKHGVLCAAGLLTIKANQWDVKRLTITPSMSWLCEQVLAQDLRPPHNILALPQSDTVGELPSIRAVR